MSEAKVYSARMDKISDRVMKGETPLQAVARQGISPATETRSIDRFPYYTAFPYAWYRACYSDEIEVGQVKPLRLLNRDLVLWRGEDGEAHVMEAYCAHLGAHLGFGGRVEGCEIVCPFHWWQYDGDGNNTLIPYEGGRNKTAKIRSFPTIDRNGLILFWYHPQNEAPMWEIPKVDEYYDEGWTDYYRGNWTMRAPWQEFAENGPDFIHLRSVHGSTDIPDLESLKYDGHTVELRAKVNFNTPRGPQEGRIDTDSWGPGFSVARFSGIIETCFVGNITPIDFEHSLVSHNYLVRKLGTDEKSLAKTQRVGDALVADLMKQVEEDLVILDTKIFNPKPALSQADGPIPQFREWAQQFYVAGDPKAVNI